MVVRQPVEIKTTHYSNQHHGQRWKKRKELEAKGLSIPPHLEKQKKGPARSENPSKSLQRCHRSRDKKKQEAATMSFLNPFNWGSGDATPQTMTESLTDEPNLASANRYIDRLFDRDDDERGRALEFLPQ